MEDKTNTYNSREIPVRSTEEDLTGEISLKDILRKLWVKRKFIVIVTTIFLMLGLVIAFSSPVKYTAQCTILPQGNRQSSTGNLGNLASIVGVNMGTNVVTDGNISASIYPEIINSLPFVREIMQVPITVEKSIGREITLYEYYTSPEYREINVLAVVKKYTIGLPHTVAAAFRPKKKQREDTEIGENINTTNDTTTIERITPQEQSVYNTIKGAIQYQYNTKEGVIKLGYTFSEPLAAAQVSEQLHKSLEKYVVTYRLEKVAESLSFVEQSYAEARRDFIQKQTNLAAFQDANRGLVTATSKATEAHLRSEYDIAFTVYNELAKQREQTQLAVKEAKPVLTILNPVIVPLKNSAPQREKIIVAFIFLGLIASCSWIFISPIIKEITKSEK